MQMMLISEVRVVVGSQTRATCQLFITHHMFALASPLVYTQVIIDDVISLSDLQWFSQNFSSF